VLRSRLPALLQASDERVLQALAPTCEAYGMASLLAAERQEPEGVVEATPILAQVPEVGKPAPTPMKAQGPGALCTDQ
jgi:hypothetical protein